MMCSKCNNTGYIPFILPDGKVSQHAKQHCPDCYNPYADSSEANRRTPVPSDYDYAMSWTTWRAICRQNGWRDPGQDTPDEVRADFEANHNKSDVPLASKVPDAARTLLKQNEQLRAMRAELAYLRNKVMEKQVDEIKRQEGVRVRFTS